MLKLVLVFGVLFIVMGAAVLISPEAVFSGMDLESSSTRYVAGVFRLFLGLVLILAAAASRFPKVFRVFGVLALFGGLVVLLMPMESWLDLVHWVMGEGLDTWRFGGGALAILIGAFIVYAALPNRAED